MSNIRTFTRAFAGGEVTPEFYGQLADAKFATGLARCLNFIPLPHGPVSARPGLALVREVKDSTKAVRLIPFTYSSTQTMVIEMGAGYFRFHTQGATLLSGAVPYEITNPYQEADLFDINFVQSADVLTLVHPGYAPRELRRLSATNWQLANISFVSAMTAPTNVAAAATPGPSASTPTDQYYLVTTVEGSDESLTSPPASCSNNLFDDGAYNTITWTAATGATAATRYNVYKQSNGLYGFIGQTDGVTFTDDNIAADVSQTPPQSYNPFATAGNYPGAVSYYEQRRCFGGTSNDPQTFWATQSGTESNLNYSIPTRDDDSIELRVIAREASIIKHLVPLGELVALTSSAEWRISATADRLTPDGTAIRPQSYVGAGSAQPVIVNNNMIYGAARGGHVRELAYSWQAGGYVTGDLSLRAPHLFDGMNIVDLAYAKSPHPVVWAVSSGGLLLGLTYVPEQQIGAWHKHDTDGLFESVTVVAEGNEDAVYVVVQRNINGSDVRFVERMAERAFDSQVDAFYVDCGATYEGAPADEISGLDWLEGKEVAILADGAVHSPRTVVGGAVTLAYEASTVHIGLAYNSDLLTLPVAFEIMGYGQGRTKNVNKAFMRVYRSGSVFVGVDEDNLLEDAYRVDELLGSPPDIRTDEIEISLSPSWQDGGQILLRRADPLPLTVISLSLEVAIGG